MSKHSKNQYSVELEQKDGTGYILIVPGYGHTVTPTYRWACIEFRGVRGAHQFSFTVADAQIRQFAILLQTLSVTDAITRDALTKLIGVVYFNISRRVDRVIAHAQEIGSVLHMFADKQEELSKTYGK